jgi:hypothetical protein
MGDTNPSVARSTPAARPYYEALNRACDAIVRCNDCQGLVTHARLIANKGLTPCCSTRRVREIRSLSLWEWFKVRTGWLSFPYRREFLREFATRG